MWIRCGFSKTLTPSQCSVTLRQPKAYHTKTRFSSTSVAQNCQCAPWTPKMGTGVLPGRKRVPSSMCLTTRTPRSVSSGSISKVVPSGKKTLELVSTPNWSILWSGMFGDWQMKQAKYLWCTSQRPSSKTLSYTRLRNPALSLKSRREMLKLKGKRSIIIWCNGNVMGITSSSTKIPQTRIIKKRRESARSTEIGAGRTLVFHLSAGNRKRADSWRN